MLIVLNNKQKAVGVINNDLPEGLHFYNDIHTEAITNNLNTLEFELPFNELSSSLIEEEGFIIYKDLDNRNQLFVIKNIVETYEGAVTVTVSCEHVSTGDLINAVIAPNSTLNSYTLDQAVNYVLNTTDWKLGSCDYLGVRDFKFDKYITVKEALNQIVASFDAEIQYEVMFNGSTVTDKLIHVVKRRGQKTGVTLEISQDVIGIEREINTDNLITAVVAVGRDGLTLKNFNGNQIANFPVEDYYISNEEAFNKYSINGRHKFGIYEDDSSNQNELYKNAQQFLEKNGEPSYTYTVKAVMLERLTGYEHKKLRIGDTIYIKDFKHRPSDPLILEARVVELRRSKHNPSNDEVVLGDYKKIDFTKSSEIERIQRVIAEQEQQWNAVNERVTQVETTANEAKNTADGVQEIAQTAQETANNAQTIANEAKDTADTAYTNASNALTRVDEVQAEVNQAKIDIANAKTDIATALELAEQSNGNYYGQTEPTDANEGDLWFKQDENGNFIELYIFNGTEWVLKIDNTKIDTAFTNAESAITIAQSAVTDASTALDKANTAITDASTANTVANEAKTEVSTLSQTVSGIATRVENNEGNISTITQTVSGLQTTVSNKADISTVTQLADNINAKVSKDDIINQINISKEGILIDGTRIHIKGTTTIDDGVIKSAMIESVDANKINATTLSAITANLGNITGGSLNIGSNKFIVTSEGELTATNATITGEINATSGTFTGTINATGGTIIGNMNITGTLNGGTIKGATINGGKFFSSGGTNDVTIEEGSILTGDTDNHFTRIQGKNIELGVADLASYYYFRPLVMEATAWNSSKIYSAENYGVIQLGETNNTININGALNVNLTSNFTGDNTFKGISTWTRNTDYGQIIINPTSASWNSKLVFQKAGTTYGELYSKYYTDDMYLDATRGGIYYNGDFHKFNNLLSIENTNRSLQLKGIDHTYMEFFKSTSTSTRDAWIGYGSYSNDIFTISQNKADLMLLQTPTTAIRISGTSGSISLRNANNTAYANLYAGTIFQNGSAVTSQREMKKNIVVKDKSMMGRSILEEINSVPVYEYHLLEDTDTDLKRTGLILDEVPMDIIDPTGKGIELYAMASFLWKAVQELSAEINELKAKQIS